MYYLNRYRDVTVVVNQNAIKNQFRHKNVRDYYVVILEVTNLANFSQFYDINLSNIIFKQLYKILNKQLPYVYCYSSNQLVIVNEFQNKVIVNQQLRQNEQNDFVSPLLKKLNDYKFQSSKNQYYKINVKAGLGSTGLRDEHPTIDALIRLAHFSLIHAKNNNLDYKIATEETRLVKADIDDFNTEIENGISLDEFSPYYLPIVDLSSMKIIGVESLLRWEKDEYRIIEAGKFKDIAEEKHIFDQLDKIVIDKTLDDYKNWLDKDLIDSSVTITINLSKQSLLSLKLVDINKKLDQYQLRTDTIEFDVSEQDLQDEDVLNAIKRLKEHGFKVSIDAFYSSTNAFHSLLNVQVNTVKVDKENLPNTNDDNYNYRFYETFINLSNSLDYSVVAKGIENKKHLTLAKELNIEYGQGYYFTEPLNSYKILGYLNKYKSGFNV